MRAPQYKKTDRQEPSPAYGIRHRLRPKEGGRQKEQGGRGQKQPLGGARQPSKSFGHQKRRKHITQGLGVGMSRPKGELLKLPEHQKCQHQASQLQRKAAQPNQAEERQNDNR